MYPTLKNYVRLFLKLKLLLNRRQLVEIVSLRLSIEGH